MPDNQDPEEDVKWFCANTIAYNSTNLEQYSQDFVSQIDSCYVRDIEQNYDWYQQTSNEVLLNLNCPSR